MAKTLQEMQKETPFEGWRGFKDGEALDDSQALYSDTIEALIGLGPTPDSAACLEILGGYVDAFNALDDKYGGFIATIEREDICETVANMALACGLPDTDCDDVPGEGRDW